MGTVEAARQPAERVAMRLHAQQAAGLGDRAAPELRVIAYDGSEFGAAKRHNVPRLDLDRRRGRGKEGEVGGERATAEVRPVAE